MNDIACAMPDSICASPLGKDECEREYFYRIDTGRIEKLVQWVPSHVWVTTTVPAAFAEGNDWIRKTLPFLDRMTKIPDNWDTEGSPRPNPAIVAEAKCLLRRLQDSDLGAIPVPFVCPVPGGGLQLEWSSSKKHLEIEFLDISTIVSLQEEQTPEGEVTMSAEYPLVDAESTRRLLDWFTTV